MLFIYLFLWGAGNCNPFLNKASPISLPNYRKRRKKNSCFIFKNILLSLFTSLNISRVVILWGKQIIHSVFWILRLPWRYISCLQKVLKQPGPFHFSFQFSTQPPPPFGFNFQNPWLHSFFLGGGYLLGPLRHLNQREFLRNQFHYTQRQAVTQAGLSTQKEKSVGKLRSR